MRWTKSQPSSPAHSLFQKRRGFEWKDHKACFFVGMSPPLVEDLTHRPGKQRPGTNYTNEFTQIPASGVISCNPKTHRRTCSLTHRDVWIKSNSLKIRLLRLCIAGTDLTPYCFWRKYTDVYEMTTLEFHCLSVQFLPQQHSHGRKKKMHAQMLRRTIWGLWNSACEWSRKEWKLNGGGI